MNIHFILITQSDLLAMFEMKSDGTFIPFKYNGEQFLNFNDEETGPKKIAEYLKDEVNESVFSNVDFTIINDGSPISFIAKLISELSTSSKLKVVNFEDILPELLLKLNRLTVNSQLIVKYQNRTYKVSINQNFSTVVEKINEYDSDTFTLDINVIPEVITSNYRFVTDQDSIEDLKEINSNLSKELDLLKTDFNNKIMEADELQKNISNLKKSNDKMNKEYQNILVTSELRKKIFHNIGVSEQTFRLLESNERNERNEIKSKENSAKIISNVLLEISGKYSLISESFKEIRINKKMMKVILLNLLLGKNDKPQQNSQTGVNRWFVSSNIMLEIIDEIIDYYSQLS